MTIDNKTASTDFGKLYKSIDDSFDIDNIKIYILVFGPKLDGDGDGSSLRNYIVNKCKSDGNIVVFTEYSEIQERYTKILGPVMDLCKMEIHLATGKDKNHGHDFIDGIILLPDSAGSLVELGMFAREESIYRKILILFNKNYEKSISDSFVGKGPKLAFENGRAMTEVLYYQDHTEAWNVVNKFLKLIRSNKYWRTWEKNR